MMLPIDSNQYSEVDHRVGPKGPCKLAGGGIGGGGGGDYDCEHIKDISGHCFELIAPTVSLQTRQLL